MIRINTATGFLESDKISKKYEAIANDIAKTLDGMIEITYKSNKIDNDAHNILVFLKARDFYQYKFKIHNSEGLTMECKQFYDWFELPCNCAASSILKPQKSSAEKCKQFHDKYHKLDFYCSIEKYITSQGKGTILKKEIKKGFVAENFPEYTKLVECFSYEKIHDIRDDILSKMNVTVCPYCNMNYTINFQEDGKVRSTADIDHFYTNTKFPLYALCLYNFIPSCQVCNSRLKHTKTMRVETHLYPHEDTANGSVKFKLENVVELLLTGLQEGTNIKLDYQVEDKSKVENSMELFKIENRYAQFDGIAMELLKKATIYTEIYNEEILGIILESKANGKKKDYDSKKFFRENYGVEKPRMNQEGANLIKQMVFGRKLTEEEMVNKSLGKFTNDLLIQFGIFKE